MARPLQHQEHVVRAVFDRHGQEQAEAIIGGRMYRVGDAFAAVAADIADMDTTEAAH